MGQKSPIGGSRVEVIFSKTRGRGSDLFDLPICFRKKNKSQEVSKQSSDWLKNYKHFYDAVGQKCPDGDSSVKIDLQPVNNYV